MVGLFRCCWGSSWCRILFSIIFLLTLDHSWVATVFQIVSLLQHAVSENQLADFSPHSLLDILFSSWEKMSLVPSSALLASRCRGSARTGLELFSGGCGGSAFIDLHWGDFFLEFRESRQKVGKATFFLLQILNEYLGAVKWSEFHI